MLPTPVLTDDLTERARRDSVQNLPDAQETWGVYARWGMYERGVILPPFGSRQRLVSLRWFDRHEYATLWQGARSGLTKRWAATPYELSGDSAARDGTPYELSVEYF